MSHKIGEYYGEIKDGKLRIIWEIISLDKCRLLWPIHKGDKQIFDIYPSTFKHKSKIKLNKLLIRFLGIDSVLV